MVNTKKTAKISNISIGVGLVAALALAGFGLGKEVGKEETLERPVIQEALKFAGDYYRVGHYSINDDLYIEKVKDKYGNTASVKVFCQGCPSEGLYQPVAEFEASEERMKKMWGKIKERDKREREDRLKDLIEDIERRKKLRKEK